MVKYIVLFACLFLKIASYAQAPIITTGTVINPSPALPEDFTTTTKVYKAETEIILTAGFYGFQSGNTTNKYFLGYISKNNNYQYFTNLKEQLDETYYQTLNCKLFFKYEEVYAIAPGALLNFVIYNPSKTIMVCPSITKTFGPNYLTLDLIGYDFSVGEMYILEVTGEKGEKKYLRFKYAG